MSRHSSFVHLRCHSDFSLMDSLIKPKRMLEAGKAYGFPAIGITDVASVAGWIRFYQHAWHLGVKPILGVDCFCQSVLKTKTHYPITLLAKSEQGCKAIFRLLSQAHAVKTPGQLPTIDLKALASEASSLILLSGGVQGELGQTILRGDTEGIAPLTEFYSKLFPNACYLEVQRLGLDEEAKYIDRVVKVAKSFQLPLVATNSVCFLEKKDFEAHNVRVAIHKGQRLSEIRQSLYSPEQYLKSPAEMTRLFQDLPSALENTVELALRCSPKLQLNKPELPVILCEGNATPEMTLDQAAKQGLTDRLQAKNLPSERITAYNERLKTELDVIQTRGFASYFLVVAEFVQWARDHNVPVGPGRGSGAGSLVAYALKITDLDPLAFGLLFERFLNPGRVSLPDFDIDFCVDGRDLVIQHVIQTYGREAVAQISTFGSLGARGVIRDVGRVLGYPHGMVDSLAQLIPNTLGMSLTEALSINPTLRSKVSEEKEVGKLFELAQQLEGTLRNAGKHAGGVVIAPTKLTDFTALFFEDKGLSPTTQFDKDDIETAGLVKFDFLGLRTLTILQATTLTINKLRAAKGQLALNLDDLPLNDEKTFALLCRAETTGVFQLESRGMQDLLFRLQPDQFEDLIALTALFRPGPLQSGMVNNFIDRKHGHEEVAYPDPQFQHPLLEPILKNTYGIILYQEQAMQIALSLAGYSLAEADLLRRAIGKKKPEALRAHREQFIAGAIKEQVEGALAGKIFDLVDKFSGYGFNRSHAAAYAMITYRSAWCKAHYPKAFMAAVLNSELDKLEKLLPFIEEVRRMALPLFPPCIQTSCYLFKVEGEGIRYGLGAIRGVGQQAALALEAARTKEGQFTSLSHLCQSLDVTQVAKSTIERWIEAGACDSLGDRLSLLEALPGIWKQAAALQACKEVGQQFLFGKSILPVDSVPDSLTQSSDRFLSIIWKKELSALGFYLTTHPLRHCQTEFIRYGGPFKVKEKGKCASCIGLIQSVKLVKDKKGMMAYVVRIDAADVWIEAYYREQAKSSFKDLLVPGEIIFVEGSYGNSTKEKGTPALEPNQPKPFSKPRALNTKERIWINTISSLETLRLNWCKKIKLVITGDAIPGSGERQAKQLKAIVEACAAEVKRPLQVFYQPSDGKTSFELNLTPPLHFGVSEKSLQVLRDYFGMESVALL